MARMADKPKESQRGMALILVLVIVFMLSALAAAMMLSNQTDILSVGNYRFATQARFTAEAGAQTAANWFMFTMPTQTSVTGLNISAYPIVDNSGNPVYLASTCTTPTNCVGTGNYPPDSSQITSFNTMNSGLNSGTTLLAGASTTVKATLLSMQLVPNSILGNSYVQSWEITSTGNISAIKPVQVQVVERIQRPIYSAISNAVFATGSGCDALNFGGNFATDSYNSTLGTYAATKNTKSGGNVGSNGNLTIGGSAQVGGNYYSPLTGIGNCSAGTPDAFSGNISAVNQIVTLGAPVVYPTPALPNPLPPTTNQDISTGSCPSGMTGCTNTGSKTFSLAPGTYGDVTIDKNVTVHLTTGTYNMDNLVANNGTIIVDSEPVTFNVTCQSCSTLPFDFTGNIFQTNGSTEASITVLYAGTAPLQKLNGNGSFTGVLYAPNASLTSQVNGTFDWYGAIVAQSVTFAKGNANIHYDVSLLKTYLMTGSWHVSSFTWSKY
jgi:Tfp pilus assembly protein PilX